MVLLYTLSNLFFSQTWVKSDSGLIDDLAIESVKRYPVKFKLISNLKKKTLGPEHVLAVRLHLK